MFSRQGFHETSISEIAQSAGVSDATIFRLYGKKDTLYYETVRHESDCSNIDLIPLQLSLTMEQVERDLMVITQAFFEICFSKISVLRIFISALVQMPALREFGYLIPPPLEQFLRSYLSEMQARQRIRSADLDAACEFYLSTLFQDITFLTTFQKKEGYDDEVRQYVADTWEKRIALLCRLFIHQ